MLAKEMKGDGTNPCCVEEWAKPDLAPLNAEFQAKGVDDVQREKRHPATEKCALKIDERD